ncbi:replication-relaxation family protein [Streptomyces sp. NPDC088921]|uniref:replication-relaxation family protein n=1 Tax=unclassified Streptomyces TaxID=2593676 RepID=UPI003421B70C
MAKRKPNEAGSSTGHRADALRVLGVLKAATADQIQRLSSPHLTYRHTTKDTAAKRKEARTASHRGALNDLRRQGLSVVGGRTRGGEEVRLLTKDGLAAAGLELDRGPQEMGGMPKSAGRSGASHAMTVNETVIAMIRPKPDLALVAGEPAEAVAAARSWVDAPEGIGTITSYATEVALPATGTWRNPGVGCAWADIVLTAAEAGVPLLFIEADNCTEEAPIIAAKFDKYMRHFHRTVKDTDGQDKPMWRTRWSAPASQWGDATHPQVLLVFHQVGKRTALTQMERVAELTRKHWQGRWAEGGYRIYDGKMAIVGTTLELLREHGPARPGPRSGASAATATRTSGTRSGTPAGTPPSPVLMKSGGAAKRRKQPNASRSDRCAPTADRSSPTTGGRPASRSTGAAGTATRTCATTARRGRSTRSGRRNRPNASAGSRSARRQRRRHRTRRPSAGLDAGAADPAKPPRQREGLPRAAWASPRCRWQLRG